MKAVNLFPPDMRGASKATAELTTSPEAKGVAGPFVVLGVLAACVAGTAAYVLTDNVIAQRKADLVGVTARQQAVQAEASKLKPYADFDAMAKARVQTVRDLAGHRFSWDQALRDLSRAIPADVTLSTLQGDLGSGSGSTASASGGGAGSGVRGAIDAPAISMQGCARDQRSVAVLMARLRNVDGVTRVSLSKSDREDTASTTATGSAAPPCGAGSHPKFELVVFFERAAAAVAAQTGSASAPAAPAATATPAPGAAATPTPSATSTPAGTTTASTAPQGGSTP